MRIRTHGDRSGAGADPARLTDSHGSVPLLRYAIVGIIATLAARAAIATVSQAVRPAVLDRANSQIAGTQIVIDEFIGPPFRRFLFGLTVFAPHCGWWSGQHRGRTTAGEFRRFERDDAQAERENP